MKGPRTSHPAPVPSSEVQDSQFKSLDSESRFFDLGPSPKPVHPPLLNKQIMPFAVFMANPSSSPSTNDIYDVNLAIRSPPTPNIRSHPQNDLQI